LLVDVGFWGLEKGEKRERGREENDMNPSGKSCEMV
jgi:hypothetical protein